MTVACDRSQPDQLLTAPDRTPIPTFRHEPLAGQIVASTGHPAWLRYHQGRHVFIAGPGDPEDFLYRGHRLSDGTRDGDQSRIIQKLSRSGANSLYMQVVRSHGGDGDETQNPFVGNEPADGFNAAVLDQWDTWLSALDAAGIVSYMFLYDDSARIWDTGDDVSTEERGFVHELVQRFEHIRHLVWVVAEEYSEAYSARRVSNIAREIKLADRRGHAVAVHKLVGLDFNEFADDSHIDQFAVQLRKGSPAETHARMLQAWQEADRRYGNVLAEAPEWGTGATARQKAWAAALGGAYVLVFEMDVIGTPDSDLDDLGRLVRFMNGTDFQTMSPLPQFARDDTRYLLIEPGRSYVAYSADGPARLGAVGMAPGSYELRWFDPITGISKRSRTGWLDTTHHSWAVPDGFGPEVALFATRVPENIEVVFPGASWAFREPATLGLSESRLEALAEEWGGAGCIARFGFMGFCWGDVRERKEWASAAKPVLSTHLLLAVQEGRLAGSGVEIADLGWPLRGHDRGITFFHLANMISGYARAEAPGQAWAYNDFAINVYGRSLEGVFGADLDSVFQTRFAPLGFQDLPALSSRGGLGLEASIRDAVRLGLLWLSGGAWDDQQILNAALARRFMTPHVGSDLPLSRDSAPDYLDVGSFGARHSFEVPHGPGFYGYNWWFNYPVEPGGSLLWPGVPGGAFQANGHYGRELITMIPSLDMVIVTVGPWGGMDLFIPGDPDAPTGRLLADIVSAVGAVESVAISMPPPSQ